MNELRCGSLKIIMNIVRCIERDGHEAVVKGKQQKRVVTCRGHVHLLSTATSKASCLPSHLAKLFAASFGFKWFTSHSLRRYEGEDLSCQGFPVHK